MNGIYEDFRTSVIISVQNALVGEVPPDLRAVAVGWEDGTPRARFIFDRPVTPDDEDDVLGIDMYVQDDFDDFTPTEFSAEYSTDPILELRRDEGWWVYVRKEPSGTPVTSPQWSAAPLLSGDDEAWSFRVAVMLSVQQALLGVVTPDIRVVRAGWEGGTARAHVILDRPVVDEDGEWIRAVEAAVAASFGGAVAASATADFSMQRPLEYDITKWRSVYARKERDE